MKKTVVILGAGITGLTLGWKLSNKFKVILIEQEKEIGGMCSSFKYNNFLLDYGPHKLYPQLDIIKKEILSLYASKPEDLLEVKKKSSIFLQNNLFSYPLELTQALTKFSPFLASGLIFSYGLNAIKGIISSNKKQTKMESYEEFLLSKFGAVMYSLVFKENAEKIWGNPKTLSSDLAKTRVSSPNLIKVILNTILKTKDPTLNAETFFYPKATIKDLLEKIAFKIKANNGLIITSSSLKAISVKNKTINRLEIKTPKKSITIKPDFFISTANLKEIMPLFHPPKDVTQTISNLKFRGLAIVYLFLNKPKALKDNWIFFPEKKFIFQRISEQKAFSSFNQPKDKTVVVAEISLREEIIKLSDSELAGRVALDLEKAGLISKSEVYGHLVLRKNNVYPLYTIGYKENLKAILTWADFNLKNFITCGRNGLFNYNNMDHCIDMAIKIAEHLKTKGTTEDICKLRSYFDSYKIVD